MRILGRQGWSCYFVLGRDHWAEINAKNISDDAYTIVSVVVTKQDLHEK